MVRDQLLDEIASNEDQAFALRKGEKEAGLIERRFHERSQ